jgi:hypothetical protein
MSSSLRAAAQTTIDIRVIIGRLEKDARREWQSGVME